ncbi:GSCFA domain-containing protein [Luteibaculum oceani]|uniref:GSCFA domain-containing protein n=1 Tax=Luteibaculum oceani TaxID=1294296 RepID=A0A5C6UXU0_9FLAO|nr:GSCFA domain-containing protein [Luteibaculum oceani]TXC77061.1 GSCFA domain-containing protein [Luteibaculum oceani]
MKFRSNFDFQYPGSPLGYTSSIDLMGSCFTERIGTKLHQARFDVENGHFGTLFNPVSIFQLIEIALDDIPFSPELICEKDGSFVHYLSHSQINGAKPEDLLANLNSARSNLKKRLLAADKLVLTFGSAFAYRLISSGVLVANCHKQANGNFKKELLSVNFIVEQGIGVLSKLKELNPKLEIIITVSPVKHLRDGVVNNKLSKSILRLVCHELESAIKGVCYLPVLEWVEDDLRDYRFYGADLAHPNEMAEQYIWEQFLSSCFTVETIQQIGQVFRLNGKIAALSKTAIQKYEKEINTVNTWVARPFSLTEN